MALSVAASLWKSPLLSVDILQSKVACITFGHPLISLPLLEEVVQDIPEFETTVHSVFLSEDTIPVMARLLDPKCDRYCSVMTADSPLLLPTRKVMIYLCHHRFITYMKSTVELYVCTANDKLANIII